MKIDVSFLFLILCCCAFGPVKAQSARKENQRLKIEYESVMNTYDSIFDVYSQYASELTEIRSITSGLLQKELFEKPSRLREVKKKLWNSAADLRMVGLMSNDFPGFPSRRLDSIGPDYAKIELEMRGLGLMGDTNVLLKKKDFPPISKGLPLESQNRILEKRSVELRTEMDSIRVANKQMDGFISDYTKVNGFLNQWGKEIDEMIAYIESTGAPVIAKWEEVNVAVQSNPEAFNDEYRKVFRKKGELFPCGFAMEFFEEGTKIADLNLDGMKTYVPAKFPGDCNAMLVYLSVNLTMPESIKGKELSKCFIRFVITEKGEVSDVEVQKGIPGCPECDEEAIRVIKQMPKWKPGSNHEKLVKSYYYLPIKFELK